MNVSLRGDFTVVFMLSCMYVCIYVLYVCIHICMESIRADAVTEESMCRDGQYICMLQRKDTGEKWRLKEVSTSCVIIH